MIDATNVQREARKPLVALAREYDADKDKDHVWHMNTISSFVEEGDGLLMRTPYQALA